MKKGKVFTKSQIALAVMVIALGAAVWLNMKYSSSIVTSSEENSKYLGEALYVDNASGSSAIQTGGSVEQNDYFTQAKKQREEALKQSQEQIEETLKDDGASESEKEQMRALSAQLAKRIEAQANIENLLIAKGFSEALAIIGENDVNIVVRSDGLLTSETLQIQEIAVAQSGVSLANVKIIPVK